MAQAKLTLSMDPDTIEFGKRYVQEKHTSLSKLVQNFLNEIARKEAKQSKINSTREYPQWIKDITLSDKPTPDFDHKAEYGKHLEEKYGL